MASAWAEALAGSGSGSLPAAAPWKEPTIFWTSQSLSALSLLLSSFVVLTLFLFPALRRSGCNRLVVNLCIANALGSFFQLNVFR